MIPDWYDRVPKEYSSYGATPGNVFPFFTGYTRNRSLKIAAWHKNVVKYRLSCNFSHIILIIFCSQIDLPVATVIDGGTTFCWGKTTLIARCALKLFWFSLLLVVAARVAVAVVTVSVVAVVGRVAWQKCFGTLLNVTMRYATWKLTNRRNACA